ncbi:MAG: hypothetical protein CMP14_05955 [Rickettsiales bacterium]|nr:hypothetical protein [Rickettsiales bacterium]|tara:strand:- start:570 stop:1190 length:621 start_codon:yes stop_codon:yes gene_type:complete
MIDPLEVKNYNRTESELEEFLLFCINVAGKKSSVEAPKLERFLVGLKDRHGDECRFIGQNPFSLLRFAYVNGTLLDLMKKYGISPYSQRYNSYVDLVMSPHTGKTLAAATLKDLLQIRGVGLKTSRFFLSNTQKDFDEPMLDTHIMSYLRDEGHKDAPRTTPQNPKVYAKWAAIFSEKARQEGKSVRELDIQVWKKYSKTKQKEGS